MARLEELACRQFCGLVTAYLDGELELRPRRWFEEHAVACEGCARYLDQLRETVALLARHGAVQGGHIEPVAKPEPRGGAAAHHVDETAFKFLGPDRINPVTGFQWPQADWVQAEWPAAASVPAVHACRAKDLPYWLGRELWRIELSGPEDETHGVRARAGRLGERVAAWNQTTAQDFAAACAKRVAERAAAAFADAGKADEATILSRPLAELAKQPLELPRRTAQAAILPLPLAELAGRPLEPPRTDDLSANWQYAVVAANESQKADAVEAAASAAYTAALAATRAGGMDGREAERGLQAEWLIRTLSLGERQPEQVAGSDARDGARTRELLEEPRFPRPRIAAPPHSEAPAQRPVPGR